MSMSVGRMNNPPPEFMEKCNLSIKDGQLVRYKETGNVIEIMASNHFSFGEPVTRKIDKDTYFDTRDGEIKNFNHNESRLDDGKSIARSMCQARDIINLNFTDPKRCRWLTLTYAENMTDNKRLNIDYQHFIRRLHKVFGAFEWFIAKEPQERGAWHIHAILLFPDKAPYMENSVVANCWKQGFVNIKKVDNCDNLGAYLSAYLCDVEIVESDLLGDDVKVVDSVLPDGSHVSKRFKKGARLHLYPPGMHIFGWSKGIKKPDVVYMSYSKAKEKVSVGSLTFSRLITLNDDDKGFSNNLVYEYYNKARDKSQSEK